MWALFLGIFGGIDLPVFGGRITSNEPLRPLLLAAIALSTFILSGGAQPVRVSLPAWTSRIDPRVLAALLAAATLIVGIAYSTTTAGGSDPYGYVSQADLWLGGDLRIEQPWAEHSPSPLAKWGFAPLGYRPIEEAGDWAIVPTYSPGLPLLMAGAKLVAGHCAVFWVVPASGAILVLVTFGLGCRLASPWAGVLAAWLVATSPTVLFMLMWPMTDVPVAAAWAAAFYFMLGRGGGSALAAGLSASAAILIRPNLAGGAGIMLLWYAWRIWRAHRTGGQSRAATRHAVLFSAAAGLGAAATGAINAHLYGSPLTSGYLGLAGMYNSANAWPNLQRYTSWIVQAETIFAFIGLAAIAVPLRRVWLAARDRAVFVAIGLFVVALWLQYLLYIVFDDWWYLRFLLASWPFMALGLAAAGLALGARSALVRTLVVVLLVAIGGRNLQFAVDRGLFELWQGERRYASIGRLMRSATEPGSVILSMQHSGSVRYYGGRMTMRFDNIEDELLDSTVNWLAANGVPVYLLAEDWELPDFHRRFDAQRTVRRLQTPVLTYTGPATILLYDLVNDRDPQKSDTFVETYEDLRCLPPAPPSSLALRLRTAR